VVKSRLPEGLSRESIQKFVDHYWATKGEARCRDGMAKVMAGEGQRVSTDHTYHVVSNLAAQDEDGKFFALKASLVSVMGQDYALGFKVRVIEIMYCTSDSNTRTASNCSVNSLCLPNTTNQIIIILTLRQTLNCIYCI